jgi:hypothetical protein
MGEPARKLDHDPKRASAQPQRQGRPGRLVPLRRREDAPRLEDTWVLDQIVLWYRTRRD